MFDLLFEKYNQKVKTGKEKITETERGKEKTIK